LAISVVIPVLNEERCIERCLDQLASQPGFDQIVVVDGGSDDHTVALARQREDVEVIERGRGRARQQNAGAAIATCDTILFLHADVELPRGAANTIERVLAEPGVAAGAFRTWHRPETSTGAGIRALLHLADLRSRYTKLPYGDQGLFMRRGVFEAVGGFPDLELMEDLALSKALRRRGTIRVARDSVAVSGRRFESAPLKQCLLVNVIPFLYAAGVSDVTLARLYGNPR